MGQCQIRLVTSGTRALDNGGTTLSPVMKAQAEDVELFTSGASSAKSSIIATTAFSEIWHIKALDTAVWLKFGLDPTAVEGDEIHLDAGQEIELGVTHPGETVAIINA